MTQGLRTSEPALPERLLRQHAENLEPRPVGRVDRRGSQQIGVGADVASQGTRRGNDLSPTTRPHRGDDLDELLIKIIHGRPSPPQSEATAEGLTRTALSRRSSLILRAQGPGCAESV